MGDWYTTREEIKRAVSISGSAENGRIDRSIESASRAIDRLTHRRFIPITQTRLYRWPNRLGSGDVLWLDQDLLSTAPTIKTKAQDTSPTTLGSTDYFLEPKNYYPPFNRVEINRESAAAFESGDTPQRSISIAGDWGYSQELLTITTLASSLSSVGTTAKVADGSKVGVGHTLKVGTERIFVTDRPLSSAISRTLSAALNANKNTVTLSLSTGTAIYAGEVIQIETEDMLVREARGNAPVVERGWDGTALSTHSSGSTLKAYRRLTVERGVNGSAAAAHSTGSTVKVYEPPFDVQQLCVAEVVAAISQERSAWGRVEGQGDGARELSGRALGDLRKRVTGTFIRPREAAL